MARLQLYQLMRRKIQVIFAFLAMASMIFILEIIRGGIESSLRQHDQPVLNHQSFHEPSRVMSKNNSMASLSRTYLPNSQTLDRISRQPNADDQNSHEGLSPKLALQEIVESVEKPNFDTVEFIGSKQSQQNVSKQLLALFGYDSLELNGLDNPLIFGAEHLKAQLNRELENGEDISNFTTLTTKEPPDFDERNAITIKSTRGNLVPFRVGDSIPPKYARQILVATTWRSGSSFTGDIFQHYPGAFYSYEPLHMLAVHAIKLDQYAAAIGMLKSLFKCQYEYFDSETPMTSFFTKQNLRIYPICKFLLPNDAACYMPEFYQAVCPLFPLQLVKTVRLRVEYTDELLADPELPNLKVIVLIRDPRGTQNSRSHLKWCVAIHCDDLVALCDELKRDITAAYDLRVKYPGRVHLVRYEDLSTDPYANVDKLFNFVGLPQNPVVEQFIKTHTQTDRSPKDFGNDQHDSKAIAFAWRRKMSIEEIHRIQRQCGDSLEKAGYQPIQTIEQRDDPNFPILSKTAEDIWPFDDLNAKKS